MKRRKITLPGTVFQRPNGRWTAMTTGAAGYGPRRSIGTFATREEAEECLERHVLLGGPATRREAAEAPTCHSLGEQDRTSELEQQTVGDYLTGWLDEVLARELETGLLARSTAQSYRRIVLGDIIPDLGHLPIADLEPKHLRTWLAHLRERGLGDRSVVKVFGMLHRAFADSDLPTNPIYLPRRDRPRVRSTREVIRPTVDDVTAWLEHILCCPESGGESLYPLWRVMATTGIRRAEACGLTWEDLEAHDGIWLLTVSRNLLIDSGTLYTGPPKSREGYRSIRLDEATAATLTAYRQATASRETVKVETRDGHGEFDFMFRWGPTLTAMNPDTVTRLFLKEWKHTRLRPGVTLHGLRHSHGSALLQAGMSEIEVAAHLGHNPQVLLTIYARDLDEVRRHQRLAATVERLYG